MAFPFLSLPLEIRLPIYRYCLPHSALDSRKDQRSRIIRRAEDDLIRWYNGTSPCILFANRQTHAEACSVLYHENTFSIYIRHPRRARLPMNESRADEDSFVLISWKRRHWAHPRNPKIPLAVIRNHSHFSSICRVHISLPNLKDLAAADLYMRTTSYASHYGLNAWVEKLRASDGKPSLQDQFRMNYIELMKGPIDEVAKTIQELPQVKEMVIVFTAEAFEVAILEFVIAALLQLRSIQRAQLLYRAVDSLDMRQSEIMRSRVVRMEPRLRDLERQLESASVSEESKVTTGISPEALEMLELLRLTRTSMLLFRETHAKMTYGVLDAPIPLLGHIMAE